jgi:hypothetical protein
MLFVNGIIPIENQLQLESDGFVDGIRELETQLQGGDDSSCHANSMINHHCSVEGLYFINTLLMISLPVFIEMKARMKESKRRAYFLATYGH